MRVESSAWMGVTNPRQRRTWVASNANWYKCHFRTLALQKRSRRFDGSILIGPNLYQRRRPPFGLWIAAEPSAPCLCPMAHTGSYRIKGAHMPLKARSLALTKSQAACLIALRNLSLIHISEPTRLGMISYAVFCL